MVERTRRQKAALLALLLGGIGGHKFYLGQKPLGIFYLAFCWSLVPALIALIEFFIFYTMSEAEFEKRYPPRVICT